MKTSTMKRYQLTIAYDGTNFAGFQSQPHQRTVQGVLEKAVNTMSKLDEYITIYGAGRTDSGVHALGQVVHFDFPHPISPYGMLCGLNSMLPLDCEVVACQVVSDDFHARFLPHKKCYQYRVSRGRFTNPFKRFYTGHYKFQLDMERLQIAIKDVIGTHDFSSFVASGSQVQSHVRTIYAARVWEDETNDEVIFEFVGNGFLYNQVRIMVATLLEIGNGRRALHDFVRLYEVKDREQCRETAPASGLYMKYVEYENPQFNCKNTSK